MEATKKPRLRVFKGLKCTHKKEVLEVVGENKFLRCIKCKTLRRVK